MNDCLEDILLGDINVSSSDLRYGVRLKKNCFESKSSSARAYEKRVKNFNGRTNIIEIVSKME